ncbi:MAG: NAD(P)H-binding protein [Acidobacteria bacterium]|nr:NAD(P)H-binding protein [Acidobacteriota bacterium]
MAQVFLTGGTGFMGRRLIGQLIKRGHRVKAVARAGSMSKLPTGCEGVAGDPLNAASYRHHVNDVDTWVHLVGETKPAPWKEQQFRAVDLVGVQEMVKVLPQSGVRHVVYVSVAQPAPMMKAYIQVRQECERLIRDTGVPATFLRPWYVLGPGRWWPLVLVPFYKLGEAMGSDGARRLGLVTLDEMIAALVWAVEHPGTRVLDVPAIREARAEENGPIGH